LENKFSGLLEFGNNIHSPLVHPKEISGRNPAVPV